MESTHITIPLSEIVDPLDPPQDRKPGYHVTDLMYAARTLADGKQVVKKGPIVDNTGMMSLGRLWEAACRPWTEAYCKRLGLEYQHSVERIEDGILANLDGVAVNGGGRTAAVIEAKCTTSVKNADPTQNWYWMQQVKAYCYIEGVNQVWFTLLYLPRAAAPMALSGVHVVTFNQTEIGETWQMLVNTRDHLVREGVEL